jgi:hypothetical protein
MEKSVEAPHKTKIYLSYDPAVPFLDMCPKEMKSAYQRDKCTPMFIETLFPITKIWSHLGVHQQMNG